MAKEEEGRRFGDAVHIGWTDVKVGGHSKKGSKKEKIRVFAICGEETLSIEICRQVTIPFVKRRLRQKVKGGSRVLLGEDQWKELSNDKCLTGEYSFLHFYVPLPATVIKVVEEVRNVICQKGVPSSKFPLHIAEFVWLYNRGLMTEDVKVNSILQALRRVPT